VNILKFVFTDPTNQYSFVYLFGIDIIFSGFYISDYKKGFFFEESLGSWFDNWLKFNESFGEEEDQRSGGSPLDGETSGVSPLDGETSRAQLLDQRSGPKVPMTFGGYPPGASLPRREQSLVPSLNNLIRIGV
jgi:hypothetical protein